MSLRLRLFVSLAAAMVLMFALAWWGMRWLADQVSNEVGQVAVAVGRQVVEVIDADDAATESGLAEVVIERTVTDNDREVITRQHRVGGRVTGVSVFVDGERIDDFELGAGETHRWTGNLDTLHFQLDDDNQALVLGDHLRRVNIPRDGLQLILQRHSQQLWLMLGGLLLLGLLGAAWAANRLSRPLLQLQLAAREVGTGQWGRQVDEQGAPEVVATIRDFNRMSSQLEELSDAAERLRAKRHLHELGEVARGLAHSLRNPLNVIGLSIDRLATLDKDAPNAAELAASARQQIQRIDRSLRAFLVLAGTTSDMQELDIRAIVADIFLEVSQGENRAVLVLEDGPEARLSGIEAEVRSAIHAIVINAVEADPEGRVSVAVDHAQQGVVVTVRDHGPGIPSVIRQRLFEPHRTTKAQGSGMGLFIAQRIICQRYAGRIDVHDRAQDGPGTEVILTLNAREPEER